MLIKIRHGLYLNPAHIVQVVFEPVDEFPVLVELDIQDGDGYGQSYRLTMAQWDSVESLLVNLLQRDYETALEAIYNQALRIEELEALLEKPQSGLEASADDLKSSSTDGGL